MNDAMQALICCKEQDSHKRQRDFLTRASLKKVTTETRNYGSTDKNKIKVISRVSIFLCLSGLSYQRTQNGKG